MENSTDIYSSISEELRSTSATKATSNEAERTISGTTRTVMSSFLSSSSSSSSSLSNITTTTFLSPCSSEIQNSITTTSGDVIQLPPDVDCGHKGTSVATVIWCLVIGLTCLAIFVVLMLVALITRHRKNKIIRAACPELLLVTLSGALLLYSLILISAMPNRATCVLHNWLRHLGFGLTYFTLVLKTWRIASIMRAHRTREYLTTNGQILRTTAAILSASAIFLIAWTAVDPEVTLSDDGFSCRNNWWEISITTGECVFLCWALFLCHQCRHAPQPYNDTQPLSYALWNELLSSIFYLYARQMLCYRPDINLFLLISLRIHFTLAVTLATLFVPKVLVIFCRTRKLRGRVVTDGCGVSQIHRLTLALNKHGAVRAMYCVPCGPLVFKEPDSAWASETPETANGSDHAENHYTRGEVDNLIQMLASLKSECELYKAEAKQLAQLFNGLNGDSQSASNTASDVTPLRLQTNQSNASTKDSKIFSLRIRDNLESVAD